MSVSPVPNNVVANRPQAVHETQPQKLSWTNADTKKLVLEIFVGLAVIFTVWVSVAAITGVVSAKLAYFTIPPLIPLTIAVADLHSQIKDYENFAELEVMKKAAPELSFKELYDEHSLYNLFHYILSDEPGFLSLRQFKNKFMAQEDICFIVDHYNLDNLVRYQVIDQEYANRLIEHKEFLDSCKRKLARDLAEIDQRYPFRSDKFLNPSSERDELNYQRNLAEEETRVQLEIDKLHALHGIEGADKAQHNQIMNAILDQSQARLDFLDQHYSERSSIADCIDSREDQEKYEKECTLAHHAFEVNRKKTDTAYRNYAATLISD